MEAQVVRDSLLPPGRRARPDQRGGPPIPVRPKRVSRRRSLYFVHSHNEHQQVPLDVRRRQRARLLPPRARASSRSRPWPWRTATLALTMAAKIANRLDSRLGEPRPTRSSSAAAFRTILSVEPSDRRTSRSACEQALSGLSKPLLEQRGATEPRSPRARDPRARRCSTTTTSSRSDDRTDRARPCQTRSITVARLLPGASIAARFLADLGMGFTGLALGAMLASATASPEPPTAVWTPARRPAALPAEGQERHLAVHERRRQPHGDRSTPSRCSPSTPARSIARDAVTRTRRIPKKLEPGPRRRRQRRQRPAAQQALSAAGRLPEARPERHRGQRLVAAHRRLRRRHRRRPLDVDDRQQPRRPDAVPLRPAHARRRVPQRSAPGSLRPRLAQRQPAAVHLDGRSASTGTRSDGHYLGPAHDAVPLRIDPANPLDLRPAAETDIGRRRAAARLRPGRPAEPAHARSSIPTTRPWPPASRPTSWPSACRRRCPRRSTSAGETAGDPAALRPRRPADARLRHAAAGRPAAGRARRALHPGPARRPAAQAPGTPTAA